MTARAAVLSLGSNLGDSAGTLQRAVQLLAAVPGVVLTGVSGVFRTAPVGVTDQPDFLNLVVLADTDLPPTALLGHTQAIETSLGRVRAGRWGPRTIDIDLVAVGDVVSSDERLTLPHPRAHERAFVLVPWLDADPAASLVGHGPVRGLLAGLDAGGVAPDPDAEVRLP